MAAPTRRRLLAAGVATALGGCLGGGPGEADDMRTDADPAGVAGSTLPLADRPKPLPAPPAELRDAARSGGPSKDGIPAIDEPQFVAPADADFLEPGDIVFGFVHRSEARVYPRKILVWHEICNDSIGGLPVSVTYCPLTGTVLGFLRGETTFGVSGQLLNNNLIMYDRETEAWWPQILGSTIPGPWHEQPGRASLREVGLIWTTWARWRRHGPEAMVLSTETGYAKNYASDPYGSYTPRGGYYDSRLTLFPRLHPDDRFHPKRVVLGARTADGAMAVPLSTLRTAGRIDGQLGETPALAVHDARFDTGYVYRNPDRAAFSIRDGTIRDASGESHDPDALPLDPVHAFEAMWFAWSGFYPNGRVDG